MKRIITLTAVLVSVAVGSSAFADPITFPAPEPVQISVVLNMDGKQGPFMTMGLKAFCNMNGIAEKDCHPDFWIQAGKTIVLELGAGL